MSTFRRVSAILTLAFALALPGSAFAATTSSTVTESVTAAAAVSMTVPASITYTMSGKVASGNIAITAITSTFTAANTTVSVTPNGAGGSNFDYAKRSITTTGTGGWTFTNIASGCNVSTGSGCGSGANSWSSATAKTIASVTGDVSSGSLDVASSIYIPAPGSYTGTLQFTLTN